MSEETPRRLTFEEAKFKVIECRDMAKHAKNPEHRAMLEHMAQTWERIAGTLENTG
jgi:hypothetical protein